MEAAPLVERQAAVVEQRRERRPEVMPDTDGWATDLLLAILPLAMVALRAPRTTLDFEERHGAASRMRARTPLIWRVRGLSLLAALACLQLSHPGLLTSRASKTTGPLPHDTKGWLRLPIATMLCRTPVDEGRNCRGQSYRLTGPVS